MIFAPSNIRTWWARFLRCDTVQRAGHVPDISEINLTIVFVDGFTLVEFTLELTRRERSDVRQAARQAAFEIGKCYVFLYCIRYVFRVMVAVWTSRYYFVTYIIQFGL